MILKLKNHYLNMDRVTHFVLTSHLDEHKYFVHLTVLLTGDREPSWHLLDSDLTQSEAEDLIAKYQAQIDDQLKKENQCQQI